VSDLRIKRVESLIRDEISNLIMRGVIKHPSVNTLLSISNVKVSKDLSFARISVSSFESENKAKRGVEGLNNASGFIHGILGKKLHMRTIPKLVFYYDNSIEKGMEVNKLIDEAIKDSE